MLSLAALTSIVVVWSSNTYVNRLLKEMMKVNLRQACLRNNGNPKNQVEDAKP